MQMVRYALGHRGHSAQIYRRTTASTRGACAECARAPCLAQNECFVTAHVCYAHPSSCHAGVCHVAEGFCVTAAGLHEALRFPTGRMSMDEVEFHREPPTDVPTMVTAFSGWIDAGEAATDAMRFLVR